jgi:hypothetical protein
MPGCAAVMVFKVLKIIVTNSDLPVLKITHVTSSRVRGFDAGTTPGAYI